MDFDCKLRTYHVHLSRLANYVKSVFRMHSEWAQTPKFLGDLDESEMTMVTLKPEVDVKKVKLALNVSPADAKVTSITIQDGGGCNDVFPPAVNPANLPPSPPPQIHIARRG